MQLFRTKTFKNDYRKIKVTDKQYVKYIKYLSLLLEDKALPPEAKDHSLIGNYSGFREFHIGGDLLVVYSDFSRPAWLPQWGTSKLPKQR